MMSEVQQVEAARSTSGPASWPMAKAAVIAASSRVGLCGARERASCRPGIVATMKVPPTSSAATSVVAGAEPGLGSNTPAP